MPSAQAGRLKDAASKGTLALGRCHLGLGVNLCPRDIRALCVIPGSCSPACLAGFLWVTGIQGRYAIVARAALPSWRKAGTRGGRLLGGAHSRSPPTPTQEKVKERRERIMVEFEKMGLFLMEEKQRLLQALKKRRRRRQWQSCSRAQPP